MWAPCPGVRPQLSKAGWRLQRRGAQVATASLVLRMRGSIIGLRVEVCWLIRLDQDSGGILAAAHDALLAARQEYLRGQRGFEHHEPEGGGPNAAQPTLGGRLLEGVRHEDVRKLPVLREVLTQLLRRLEAELLDLADEDALFRLVVLPELLQVVAQGADVL